MGLFTRLRNALQPSQPAPAQPPTSAPVTKKPPAPIIRVEYLNEYTSAHPITAEQRGGYAYYWRADGTPALGQKVLAPVMSGYWEEAVIIGFGRDGYKGRLKSITRTAR